MFVSVFSNVIYLLFPLMCYFIYLIYSKVRFEKEKYLFLDLAIFSSYYICSRFEEIPIMFAFIINVPFLLALHKKRVFPSLILSFCIPIFLSKMYVISPLFLICEYILIFLFSFFSKIKIIHIFLIFKVIFTFIISIFIQNYIISLNNFIYFIILLITMYIVFNFIILFYAKAENVVNMYYSLEDITKEKKLYESLFKITHEIKNPIAVCKGYLEMFDIKNQKKANKYINIINQEIDRTLVLLKDFSDISKIKIEKNFMDINMLLDDVCDEVSVVFNDDINFSCEHFDEEVLIYGDYNRLKQVLINLIKNAKESIEKKGEVVLKGKIVNKNYVIYVEDNGIGMDKETKNKIGTAFYTTKKNGTGLGVCLSKEIIQRHNGSINYFSKQYKGTKVKVILPINNKASA